MGRPSRGGIETGKWYDIRIDYSPDHVVCYLDGKQMASEGVAPLYPIYCISGRKKDGTVVLKITNVSKVPQPVQIDLQGLAGQAVSGDGDVLTSGSPNDENTLDDPMKVSPKSFKVPQSVTKFTWTCPGDSLTVLRLRGK